LNSKEQRDVGNTRSNSKERINIGTSLIAQSLSWSMNKDLYFAMTKLTNAISISLKQRFSNCGPRTTSGPRVLPLWSFRLNISPKNTEKIKLT